MADTDRHRTRYGTRCTPRIIERAAGSYAGNLTLPTPNAYRSPFRQPDGSYEAELSYCFDLIGQQSSGTRNCVTTACLERGLYMNIVQMPGMGGIFRIAPPPTVSEDELDSGLDILEASLKAVLAGGS